MPLPLEPCAERAPPAGMAVVDAVFGTHYAVITVMTDQGRQAVPIAITAVVPFPDYHAALADAIRQALPVVECVAQAGGETLSEIVIANGWALPPRTGWRPPALTRRFVAALQDARAQGRGIWSEAVGATRVRGMTEGLALHSGSGDAHG